MKNPWVIIGVITVVLFGGAIVYSNYAAEQNNEGVEILEHVKGNEEATVTLTEYSDFQCPACASFQPVLNGVLEEYGDNLRFEYKHFPLPIHNYAMPAAVAAEAAAQQGKFFEYHDALFANQQAWSNSNTANALFIKYAEELDLDMDLFRRHMNASVLRDKVRDSVGEGRALKLTGTPTFFLNGERMEFDSFPAFIEQIALAVDPSSASTTKPASNVKFGI
ncbi:thioredoxin domain-containing protein [Candidatus Kaiserbacteria bacterium]|nr:thioredoxin domain-containing protein [Candidatus Kaiserbacteria bacterium]